MQTSFDLSDNKSEGKSRNHHWWQQRSLNKTLENTENNVTFGPPVTHDRKLEASQARRLGARAKEKFILSLTEPKIEKEPVVDDPYADYVDLET